MNQIRSAATRIEETGNGMVFHMSEESVSGNRFRHMAMETKMYGGHQVSWSIVPLTD